MKSDNYVPILILVIFLSITNSLKSNTPQIHFSSYKKTIQAGKTTKIRLNLENAPSSKTSLLILQLRSPSNTKKIIYRKKIKKFPLNGSKNIKAYIPHMTPEIKNAHWVTFFKNSNGILSKSISKKVQINSADDFIIVTRNISTLGIFNSTFSLYIPPKYNENNPSSLLVVLHGRGGNGKQFIESWIDTAKQFNMILLSPSAIDPLMWNLFDWELIKKAIQQIKSEYKIKENNTYLSGVSAGAIATYLYGLNNTNIFKAIAPIAGIPKKESEFNIDPEQIPLPHDPHSQVPILNILGDKDLYFFNDSTDHYGIWMNHLKQSGYQVKDILYPNRGHTFVPKDTLLVGRFFSKNHSPMLGKIPDFSIVPGQKFKYQFKVKDPDNDSILKFKLKKKPKGLHWDRQSYTMEWSPKQKQTGIHKLKVIVIDNRKGKSKQKFHIEVKTTP